MPPKRHKSPRLLTKDDIDKALSMLDEGIGLSDLLLAVAPIRFITVGGMLAVSVFGNRPATKDIDFLLDPNVDAVQEYRDEIRRVIRDVAVTANLSEDWMNDDFQIFVGRSRRPSLFMRSIEQGVVAYRGTNIVVYAGRIDFALERKLRRIGDPNDRARELDISDAVSLIHWLKREGGGGGGPPSRQHNKDHNKEHKEHSKEQNQEQNQQHQLQHQHQHHRPLSFEWVQNLDENQMGIPIRRGAIEWAAREYENVYKTQGIVDMVWDEQAGRYKYINLDDEDVFL